MLVISFLSIFFLGVYRDWISQIAAHGFVTLQPLPLNGGFQFGETLQWVSWTLK